MALPTMIHVDEVTRFKFFRQGCVRDGMEYQKIFYGKLDEASPDDASRLYQLALVLTEQELPCVITTSLQSYSLWVSLRSPTYQVFLKAGGSQIQKALSLHCALCRCKQARLS